MNDTLKKHRQSVKALGYSDEQADDLIHRLSDIMSAFIDAAWGVHPAQLSVREGNKGLSETRGCGKLETKVTSCDRKDSAVPSAER